MRTSASQSSMASRAALANLADSFRSALAQGAGAAATGVASSASAPASARKRPIPAAEHG
jgi:hypothetical protein